MAVSWIYDVTLSTPAGPLQVIDGAFNWDRGWSPLGQGSFTVPLTRWNQLGLSGLERHPMVINVNSRNYETVQTLATDLPGATLEASTWPTFDLKSIGGEPTTGSTNWHVYMRSVDIDHAAQTATVEVQTFELALIETVNTFIPWMPAGLQNGMYDAADVLRQMFRYIGIHVPINVTTEALIPMEEMVSWDPGQDAWTYWDRVRLLGELGAYYSPSTGIITIEPARNFVGTVPTAVTGHTEEFASSDFEGAQYADALTVNWGWTVQTPDGPEEMTAVTTAFANGLGDWRNARRHVTIDRIGPVVPTFTQRAVNNMARFKRVHTVTLPTTPLLLATAPGLDWQQATFNFEGDPTTTLTILTS